MKVRKARKGSKDYTGAFKIAKDLKEWFTKEGLRSMKTDFLFDNLAVATDKNKVFGFLCYSSNAGVMQLIWMGVKREYRRKGVGRSLLNWLVAESMRAMSFSSNLSFLTF